MTEEVTLKVPSVPSEDPGAHELDSSDDDHFSDAQSAQESSLSSPNRLTAFDKGDKNSKAGGQSLALDTTNQTPTPEHHVETPGGRPIPLTVVEKIEPETPSHGEVPGTAAHDLRMADAVPDLVVKSRPGSRSPSVVSRLRAGSTPGDLPIPITKIEKVDSEPSYGEVPGTQAYELREEDATPDEVEVVGDFTALPTSNVARSAPIGHTRRKSSLMKNPKSPNLPVDDYDENEDEDVGDFGDDFDDFEEGDEDGEFGDFNDDFPEQEEVVSPPSQSLPLSLPTFPVLDFDEIESLDDVLSATTSYVDAIFPPDSVDVSRLPQTTNSNPIFLTERSASLWSQLVAPPPLQQPNWIRSRIRRLFLVSLGVPVDLDEILPASKQKKLILPSMTLNASSGSPRTSFDSRALNRLKQDGNNSSTSVDSQGKERESKSKRRKGPPPAPELDLVYARQLCTITDEALNGLDMDELKEHVAKLVAMEELAKEVLDYWTKTTDGKLGDREAFEGVIENLVKHARKVRK